MPVQSNIREFELSLDKYVERLDASLNVVVRNVVNSIFNNVIILTPVLTGWAWTNWYVSINERIETAPGYGPGGTEQIYPPSEPGPGVAKGKIGDTFWLQNGVPYILALEHGWSGQAPYGMVSVAIASAQAFIDAYGAGQTAAQARSAALGVPGAGGATATPRTPRGT